MQVLLLLGDINLSPLALTAALERDPLVSHVAISDKIRGASDADVAIIRGACFPETLLSVDEIVAQVRAIARTHRGKDKIVLDADRRQAVVLGRRVTLTLLEGNLLATFMARPAEVLDRRALMTSVWGSSVGARSTVSAYIRRLRVKIEPDPSNPVFIRTVWAGGYVFRPEGEH